MVLVVDEVVLQNSIEYKLEEFLDVASWWKRQRDAVRSVAKCPYLKLPRGRRNGEVYLDVVEFKIRDEEKYLVMSLRAQGMRANHYVTRMEGTGQKMQELVSRRFRTSLYPCKEGPAFNALVQSK